MTVTKADREAAVRALRVCDGRDGCGCADSIARAEFVESPEQPHDDDEWTRVAAAIAQARAEGRRAGVEEAARVCEEVMYQAMTDSESGSFMADDYRERAYGAWDCYDGVRRIAWPCPDCVAQGKPTSWQPVDEDGAKGDEVHCQRCEGHGIDLAAWNALARDGGGER